MHFVQCAVSPLCWKMADLVAAGPDTACLRTAGTGRKTSEKLRLLHANEMTGVVEGNQQLRRLIDNVRFRHGQTDISCNLAIDYPGQERWLLIGNVLIKDKEKTLKADTVIYVAKSKLYRALRNVELMTDSTKIFATS